MDDFVLGVVIGGILCGLFVWGMTSMIVQRDNIEQIIDAKEMQTQIVLKAMEDCKIKEYYYLDAHRELCDKIEVTP